MSLGDKIATLIYWLMALAVVGPLGALLAYKQLEEFVWWQAAVAVFSLGALALGARQCYRTLRRTE
jgi:predicted membrane channel-forming protein YqfA (hemolysin III family)